MRSRFLLVAVLFFCAVALSGATVTLVNPGYETSWTGSTTVSGWVRSSTSSYFQTYRYTTEKYAGTASLRLYKTSTTTYNIRQDVSGAVAGNTYTAKVRVLNKYAYSRVRMYLRFLNSSGTDIGYSYSAYSTVSTSTWQLLSASKVAPAGTAKVRLQLYYYGYPATSNNNYVMIDGWTLEYTTPAPVASTKPGMGAIPYTGGVTFRVWAPNGTAVAVAGDFNSWSGTATVLVSEGNGYWSRDVAGAAAGQTYKYVITHSGGTVWKNDPYARQVTSSVGDSIIKNRTYSWSAFTMPNWGELVIYQLHVKTWVDGFTGTGTRFDKVASKAAYLKDSLAVNAVKLLPVAEFPGDYSWGYNPSHLFAVESHYGGYDAYKNMVNILHQNGIAVIQDIVHNHYGPSDLDLWCFDGPSLGNGGIYFYTDVRKVTRWGDTRPDYGRSEVRSFIKDNAIYWLEEMNCDGLRWDSTVNIRKYRGDGDRMQHPDTDNPSGWQTLQYANNEKNAKFSWKISIAEDLENNDWITKTTGAGGAGFDSQWCEAFIHSMRGEVKKGNDGDRNMYTVRDMIAKVDNGNATKLVKYCESHDECAGSNGKQRLVQDIDNYNARSYWAKKRAGLAVLTAILSPGIPMFFQGQENLETGNWHDTVNFNWADTTTFAGYVQMIRDAVRLKRNWYNNTRGLRGNSTSVHHVNNTGKVIAFHRWESGGAGDDVIVVINFGNTQYSSYNLGAPSSGTWYCRYNSDWNGYDAGFGNYGGYNTTANAGAKDGMGYNMNVGVGGYSVAIYSK